MDSMYVITRYVVTDEMRRIVAKKLGHRVSATNEVMRNYLTAVGAGHLQALVISHRAQKTARRAPRATRRPSTRQKASKRVSARA